MNAERERDIPLQPDPACPLVDKAAAVCKTAESAAIDIQRSEDLGEMHDLADTIENAAASAAGLVEDLRTRCEDLRAWGQAWKDYALSEEEV